MAVVVRRDMYTGTGTYGATMTDAAYRQFFTALHTALLDAGWVATSDTGQADLSTVTWPASTSAWATIPYRVYEINDDLSGSHPIYMRLGVGRTSAGSQTYTFMVTPAFGTGTDGAGNLTPTLDASAAAGYFSIGNVAATGGTLANGDSAGGWRWAMVEYAPLSSARIFINVERLRGPDLLPLTHGIHVTVVANAWNSTSTSNSQPYSRQIDFDANLAAPPATWSTAMFNAWSSDLNPLSSYPDGVDANTRNYWYHTLFHRGYWPVSPSRVYCAGNINTGSTFDVTFPNNTVRRVMQLRPGTSTGTGGYPAMVID